MNNYLKLKFFDFHRRAINFTQKNNKKCRTLLNILKYYLKKGYNPRWGRGQLKCIKRQLKCIK